MPAYSNAWQVSGCQHHWLLTFAPQTTAVSQWLRVRQPTVAVGAWYKLRMCSAEACCWLVSKSRAMNSSWYVVSYTGMQLTAFLPSGIVVRLPAALLACFSLQHHNACHAYVPPLCYVRYQPFLPPYPTLLTCCKNTCLLLRL